MTLKLADDCFVLDKDRLPHGEALAILKSRVRPVVEMEEVTLESAAGRYLAEAIVAPRPDGTVRIFTGAVMPSGHDTVAMQEFVSVEEQAREWFATVPSGLKQGI